MMLQSVPLIAVRAAHCDGGKQNVLVVLSPSFAAG